MLAKTTPSISLLSVIIFLCWLIFRLVIQNQVHFILFISKDYSFLIVKILIAVTRLSLGGCAGLFLAHGNYGRKSFAN
jgi:hypothetical protein